MKTYIFLLSLIAISTNSLAQVGGSAPGTGKGTATYSLPSKNSQKPAQKQTQRRELIANKGGTLGTDIKSTPLLNKVIVNPNEKKIGSTAKVIFLRDFAGVFTPIEIYVNNKKVGNLNTNSSLEYYFALTSGKNTIRIESEPQIVFSGENKKLTNKLDFFTSADDEIYVSCNYFVNDDFLTIKKELNVDKSYLKNENTGVDSTDAFLDKPDKKQDVKTEILMEYQRGNYDKIISPVKEGADAGDAEYQYMLGNMYYNGLGVRIDKIEAEKYYKQFINNPNANNLLMKKEVLAKIDALNEKNYNAPMTYTEPKSTRTTEQKKKFRRIASGALSVVVIVVLIILDPSLVNAL